MNYLIALLAQLITWLLVILADEYAGTLFAVILGTIAFAIWALSRVIERIEPSRVSSAYYRYLTTGWLAPAIALVAYVALRGRIEWMIPA